MKTTAAYGTWTSALSGEFVAGRSSRLGELQWVGNHLYWLETRPAEMGRQALMCSHAGAPPREVLPTSWSVRSKMHEYGGGSYCATPQQVFFVNATDQQIYELRLHDNTIHPLTDTPFCRYADLRVDFRRQRLYAVCEDHEARGNEPQNRLVEMDFQPNAAARVVEAGFDFVSSPRLSPDGTWLAYLTWNHPHMPWDQTQLWIRSIGDDGAPGPATLVAGGDGKQAGNGESITQPQWSPSGELFWISDKTGWWNLYRCSIAASAVGTPESIYPLEAEFASPQWIFNASHYGFLDQHTLLATYTQGGVWRPVLLCNENPQWRMETLDLDCCAVTQIACHQSQGALLGAGTARLPTLWLFQEGAFVSLVEQSIDPLATGDIAVARSLTIPSDNTHIHAFFYPPANATYIGPEDQLPPVIVIGHGGPTSATDASLNFKIQFWTQRGFAVLDVNYRGSTGFGRPYREALHQAWGLADVADLCAAAEYVTTQGWVHPRQRIVRGSSAGGYSVLCALTDRDTFNAGVSLYGIGDLETLVRDTHKFEAHYLNSLVGPYPAAKQIYRDRSPVHKAARIRCPLLVFQGMEDKVVPPAQAEAMVAAVRRADTPVAYVTYADEGHGFRNGPNIQHQLDTELAFYQEVFGLADSPHTELNIANWPEASGETSKAGTPESRR